LHHPVAEVVFCTGSGAKRGGFCNYTTIPNIGSPKMQGEPRSRRSILPSVFLPRFSGL